MTVTNATKTIAATLDVRITHMSGPEIANPSHVLAWVCADAVTGAGFNGFVFEVCPVHADPDQCDCFDDESPYAKYHAAISAAHLNAPEKAEA